MLLVWPAERAALFVPVLLLGAGGVLLGSAVVIGFRGSGVGTALPTALSVALFGAAILWTGLAELLFIRVRGDKLLVRGPLGRREFAVRRCALGVRLRASTRSAHYWVFVTDGENRADLGEYATERGAERGVERLTSALWGSRTDASTDEARSDAVAVEAEWRRAEAQTQRVLADYYRSPRWRRTPFVVAAALLLYVLCLAALGYLSAKKL